MWHILKFKGKNSLSHDIFHLQVEGNGFLCVTAISTSSPVMLAGTTVVRLGNQRVNYSTHSCNTVPVLSCKTTHGSGELQSRSRSTVTRNGTFWCSNWRAAARLLTHATVNWLRGPLLSLNSKSLNICCQATPSNIELDDWKHRGFCNRVTRCDWQTYWQNSTDSQHYFLQLSICTCHNHFFINSIVNVFQPISHLQCVQDHSL